MARGWAEVLPEVTTSAAVARRFCRNPIEHVTKGVIELTTCRIATAGEGYGNFHERPLVEILNRIQEAVPYRLHAERRIGDYRALLDPALFGASFSHACALRGLLTMLARTMREEGIVPGDRSGVARANAAVARMGGGGGCRAGESSACAGAERKLVWVARNIMDKATPTGGLPLSFTPTSAIHGKKYSRRRLPGGCRMPAAKE